MKKIYSLLLLGGLLLLGVQSALADEGLFGAGTATIFYSTDNGATDTEIKLNRTADDSSPKADDALGEVSSLSITRYYINVWKNNGNITGASLGYAIGEYDGEKMTYSDEVNDDASYKSYWNGDNGTINQCWAHESYNLSLVSSSTPSGKYAFKYWMKAVNGSNEYWCSNNSQNYYITYTVMPPAVSGFAVSGTGDDIIGGDGTIDNPYIIKNGGSLSLSVSGSKARTDANSTYKVQFDDETPLTTGFSKEISDITSTEKTSVIVKAYCENSTDELTGTESTQTIYYKAGEKYSLSITSAGWASLYLGYPVDIPAGVSVYTAGVQNGEWVTLNSVSDVIPANTGVIVKGSGTNYFYQNGSTASSISSLFEGVLESTSVTANTVYVLSPASTTDACVFSLYTGTTLGANKVYIDKNNLDPQTFVPSIRFIFEEGNNTTGVENIESTENAVMFFENGQLRIRRNGVVYDITGKMVK